jgi:pimeloyl-ACP methyl ester carboxylesterase
MTACASSSDDHAAGGESAIEEDALVLASQLPAQCASPEIVRVKRPVASDGAAPGTWSYGYRFKAPATPGAPVIVALPGGPGGTFTGADMSWVPKEWGYLLTDPRGVGCNTLANLPSADLSGKFFRTTEIAQDVIAAIEHQKLEGYILFGVSYGTLLATHVAHGLEAANDPAPRAVVLEGVLGRAFAPDFVGAEYLNQWTRIRGVLPADVLTELDTKDAPFGIDQQGWSHALISFLPYGAPVVANNLAALTTTHEIPEQTRNTVLQTLRDLSSQAQHTEPGEIEMYREVACREIMDTVPASDLDVVFSHGQLVRNSAEEGTKCRELHTTTPFDSAALQFSANTYYFLGDTDVATPLWQGTYHYDHHQGHATKVVTKGGGHNSLRLNQQSCTVKVMASVANDGQDLPAALATCPMPVQVDTK